MSHEEFVFTVAAQEEYEHTVRPSIPLTNSKFIYRNSANTNVQKTWMKFGWTRSKQMQVNADYIINAIDHSARTHYRDGEADRADRLAYQVGALQGKIRELCRIYENAQDEIKQLQLELIAKDSK